MATLVDSSVLVAAKNTSDAQHDRAIQALSKAELPLLVHEYVILETTMVLFLHANKETADSFIRHVLGNAAFSILFSTNLSFLAGITSFTKAKTKLSFTDATLLALSDMYEVLTFDETLLKSIKKKTTTR